MMRGLGNVAQDKIHRACKCDSRKGRAAEKQKERQEIIGAIPDKEVEYCDSYDIAAQLEWQEFQMWGEFRGEIEPVDVELPLEKAP